MMGKLSKRLVRTEKWSKIAKKELILRPKNELFWHFETIFRSERAVLTIFPSYIMSNRTIQRMKKLRYPPFKWKLYMVNEETLKDVLIDITNV